MSWDEWLEGAKNPPIFTEWGSSTRPDTTEPPPPDPYEAALKRIKELEEQLAKGGHGVFKQSSVVSAEEDNKELVEKYRKL